VGKQRVPGIGERNSIMVKVAGKEDGSIWDACVSPDEEPDKEVKAALIRELERVLGPIDELPENCISISGSVSSLRPPTDK